MLQNAGIIEEPYYRYNQQDYQWIAKTDWIYSRAFSVDANFLAANHVVLVADVLFCILYLP